MSNHKVYVAGPYSKGRVTTNVVVALDAGRRLLEAGHLPFVPHLAHFWHAMAPQEWETWLWWGMGWLRECDALVRLPGESRGADIEVEQAKAMGIPVFGSVEEAIEGLASKGEGGEE